MPKPNSSPKSAARRPRTKNQKPAEKDVVKTECPRAQKDAKSQSSAIPPAPSTTSLEAQPKQRPAGPPIPLDEALRASGFDERAWAESMVRVVDKLKGRSDRTGSVEKLLLDALKECSRHLNSPAPASKSSAGRTPVVVQLVHAVSRPSRILTAPAESEAPAPAPQPSQ